MASPVCSRVESKVLRLEKQLIMLNYLCICIHSTVSLYLWTSSLLALKKAGKMLTKLLVSVMLYRVE